MKPFPPTNTRAEAWTFPRKVLLVAFALLLALITWQLLDLIMLAFGAVIVATVLRSLAAALERHARVPTNISVMASLLLVVFMISAVFWLVGEPLAEQFENLRQRLPAAVDAVMQWLNSHRIGVAALQYIEEARGNDTSPWAMRVAGAAGSTFGALSGAALMLVMGLYLTLAPRVYRDGLVRLMPLLVRERVGEALDACGSALSRWLLGQSASMLFVGATTALGLALVIQQIEGNVLMPLVERWAVGLPPVLGIAATIMFGALFGLLGVLLAAPAMIVLMVVVQRIYIKGVLEEGG